MEDRLRGGARVLVAYATKFGSTGELAEAVAEEMRGAGCDVEVRRAEKNTSVAGFDAVVVGGPMIFGWHKDATAFVKARREELRRLPVVYFITAGSLTEDGTAVVDGVPIVKDTWLVKPPARSGKPSYRERYARPAHYLGDVLKETHPVRPLQVAFFGGVLDLSKMNILQKLFVMLVIGATPGDLRHWEAVREWARRLPDVLLPEGRRSR